MIEFVHWPDSNANLYTNLPSATKLLRVRFSLRIKKFFVKKTFSLHILLLVVRLMKTGAVTH